MRRVFISNKRTISTASDMLYASPQSLWEMQTHVPRQDFPEVPADHKENDVVIVGGGLFGLITAILIKKKTSLKVTVLEARRVGQGVTGNSTAKLSILHRLSYSSILEMHGHQGAREFAGLNAVGFEEFQKLIKELDIKCDFQIMPSFTYTTLDESLEKLKKGYEACKEIGLPVTWHSKDIGLPFEVKGAVRLEDQGVLNPIAFCNALAQELNDTEGCFVFENSRVLDVEEAGLSHFRHKISLENGRELEAKYVVIATHLPILDRGNQFATTYPSRSYCSAFKLKRSVGEEKAKTLPPAAYISAENLHTRSIRPAGDEILVVAGEGHVQGEDEYHDTRKRFELLHECANKNWDVEEFVSNWSAHDFFSPDSFPYMGYLHPATESIFTATGFAKWGFAQS